MQSKTQFCIIVRNVGDPTVAFDKCN